MKIINMDGVVGWDILPKDIEDQLLDAEDITINLNSVGGSVTDGWTIYNKFKTHSQKYEVIFNIDLAASIASVIALSGTKIRMHKYTSLMMIHNAIFNGGGNAKQLRKMANDLDKISNEILQLYIEKTGGDEATIRDMMDTETYLTAQESLELGFIDEIIQVESKKEAIQKQAAQLKNMDISFDMVALDTKLSEIYALKSPDTLADVENNLRRMGASRSESKAMVSKIKELVSSKTTDNTAKDNTLDLLRDFKNSL